jgi:hypothetical protein
MSLGARWLSMLRLQPGCYAISLSFFLQESIFLQNHVYEPEAAIKHHAQEDNSEIMASLIEWCSGGHIWLGLRHRDGKLAGVSGYLDDCLGVCSRTMRLKYEERMLGRGLSTIGEN